MCFRCCRLDPVGVEYQNGEEETDSEHQCDACYYLAAIDVAEAGEDCREEHGYPWFSSGFAFFYCVCHDLSPLEQQYVIHETDADESADKTRRHESGPGKRPMQGEFNETLNIEQRSGFFLFIPVYSIHHLVRQVRADWDGGSLFFPSGNDLFAFHWKSPLCSLSAAASFFLALCTLDLTVPVLMPSICAIR